MSDLVRKLTEGDHLVEARMGPEKTIEGFKAALDRGYVNVRFAASRGGTQLGFKVDKRLSDLTGADFDQRSGTVKICGDLTLDYERVRCVAEIELSTLSGRGHLELLS